MEKLLSIIILMVEFQQNSTMIVFIANLLIHIIYGESIPMEIGSFYLQMNPV